MQCAYDKFDEKAIMAMLQSCWDKMNDVAPRAQVVNGVVLVYDSDDDSDSDSAPPVRSTRCVPEILAAIEKNESDIVKICRRDISDAINFAMLNTEEYFEHRRALAAELVAAHPAHVNTLKRQRKALHTAQTIVRKRRKHDHEGC
jgi:hypothetical protein